jgi:hypothetical protein
VNTTSIHTESPAALAVPADAPVADGSTPDSLTARGWFLRAVLGGSLVLVAGFWTVVGMTAASLL